MGFQQYRRREMADGGTTEIDTLAMWPNIRTNVNYDPKAMGAWVHRRNRYHAARRLLRVGIASKVDSQIDAPEEPLANIPVINLAEAPGERTTWARSPWKIYAWSAAELIFVTNPWQVSSSLRVAVLRLFGAQIGRNVTFRPRTRVKFPWNLNIGDRSWIGEGVWFHNQATIKVGSDVVISQETFLTTGSHRHRSDMALITREIIIDSGAWLTSRCMVLGGSRIGTSALIYPMSRVSGDVPPNAVWDGTQQIGERFR
jgi:putative colanic acid biosynthesis acetyltransferase WcaF